MKKKLKLGILLTTLSLILTLTGCQSSASSVPIPVSLSPSATVELMQDPQFPAMAQVAPDLTKKFIHRIHALELKLANAGITP